ncbi:MAG TPA: WD40 repeat domain-containing serine/threonine-protein kinase, partial [Planctomycetota bacterium]|nr:WD40 repeat domain-containing serine/threonine-protein kinase [Planctomycetota bacterium]
MQDNIWQVESILENTYKITNVLPKGQYGQSYCIDHIQWNMPLRIKKLNNLQDRYSRHALDSWIHASESMFLVNAYVIKDIDSQSCLITEYIEGVSWGTYIQQSILDKERLYIALQLTNALLEIHSKNIVHGNLHPQNILINHNSRLFLNDLTCRYSEDGNIFKKDLQNYAVHLYELFSQKTFTGDFEWTQEAPWNPLVEICFQSQPLHILSDIFEVLQNQYEAYEQRYTKNLWLSATIQVESIHKPAFGNIERKNLKEAEYLWRCASEAYPPSMNAIWNYYLCKLRKGLITPCMFINLLTEQPTDKEKIYCMQAEIALEFGCQVLEVLKNLQEYNALNLARTESLDLEAELLYRVRKYEEAKEKWLAIFDLDNLSSKECYKLTISCYACGDKQGAREFCDKGLQLHPHSNLLQLVDAILTMDKNEDEEIVSEKFQILETKYGSVYWIMMHVAEYYATLGTEESQEQAQEIYQELLKINPLSQRALKWYSACEGNQLKYNIGQMQLEEWSQIQTLQKHENIITALAMTPDGKIAVSGDCEGRIHCWNIENSSYWMELVGHTKHITSLAISTDAKIVASGSWDQEVKIWDMETGKEIRNILFHEQTISSIKITTDNKQIIIGSWDGKASIWNLEEIENNEKPISILNISELWITDVALIENTNLAITCDEHERMSIWDIEKQEIITTMRGLSVLLAQNNKVAVSSRYDHIEIWEIPSGRCLRGMETQGKEICLSLSNDNLFLLTRNEDDIISVWDLCHCQRIAHLQSTECLCASMSSDGSIIVSGTEKDLYLWENISLRTFPLFKKACYLGSNFHQYTSTPELILKYARDAEKASKEKQYKSAFFHLKKIQSTPGYETATNLNNFILETALQADLAL